MDDGRKMNKRQKCDGEQQTSIPDQKQKETDENVRFMILQNSNHHGPRLLLSRPSLPEGTRLVLQEIAQLKAKSWVEMQKWIIDNIFCGTFGDVYNEEHWECLTGASHGRVVEGKFLFIFP